MASDADDAAATVRDFAAAVNMTPAALEKWLATGESRAVGITQREGTESVGHPSGRRIVELLQKKDAELGDSDLAHMRKVVGDVQRPLAQRPVGDVRHTRRRWSLTNGGHDPLVSRRACASGATIADRLAGPAFRETP